MDINYVDFLQFQRYFTPQAELEEAFIYIIHKPIDFSIDFSCRLKTIRKKVNKHSFAIHLTYSRKFNSRQFTQLHITIITTFSIVNYDLFCIL